MFLSKHITYPNEFLINDIRLQVEDSVELLGVTIDKNLNFSKHIEKLCKRANFKLMAMKRLRPYISEKKALLLAKTFICSQFNYCLLVWMFCDKYHNSKINKIQKKTLRNVFSDYSSTFEELLYKGNSHTVHVNNLQYLMIEYTES